MPVMNNYICLSMKRRKIIPDPVLMLISILGIAVFQLYWLKQSYSREEKTLAIKSEVTFRQTIQQLRVAKLKLDGLPGDSIHGGKVKVFINEGNDEQVHVRFKPGNEIVSTINIIRDKLKDSLGKNPEMKKRMTISLNNDVMTYSHDSIKIVENVTKDSRGDKRTADPGQDHYFRLLYGVDSLQDSLKLKEINIAYAKALQNQKLNIPFSVIRRDSSDVSDEPAFNEVTVGFAHPITYKLTLGNTVPYLMKRISLPILFSILLLSITILSFILLYRTLLKQKRLAELKNEFISNITHELKTPIATVGVAIEALKNFNAIQDPQRTKEYLDISSNELQRLSLLVDKVLKLSMFEKKEIELRYEPMNLKEVIEEVTTSMRLQLEKHHAVVSITHEGDLAMQGDRLHLQSVVFNLLDNAIKYGKTNPVIEISLKEQDSNIVMNIADNGIGILPEYKDKVFDKFFRIPHGDTHNAKGYGLGLSYVAQVVQKHKGTITVDSQPDIGTKFSITLPKQSI